ncbi:CNBP [Mytilus edulis]|uniref:CNBP n=1 Tax=Mytilus edulis TaxID=6550 RepID=A0A8S3S0I6_MYTED|nr:CNBP [Mytilus edulis]
MSDITISGHISKFGDIVHGSLRRGIIKDKNIETGTRNALTKCIPVTLIVTKFGRFSVRVFAYNNKTECPYCMKTDHPSYRCANKHSCQNQAARSTQQYSMATYNKDCPHPEKLCFWCGKEGHIQKDCQTDDQELYGDYVHDIQEGRDANKDDSFTEDNNTEEVIIELNKTTERTNDISKHRSDTEQITANLTTCIDTVKTKYPNARIGTSSILPRRGISAVSTTKGYYQSFLRWNNWPASNRIENGYTVPAKAFYVAIYLAVLTHSRNTVSPVEQPFYSLQWIHSLIGSSCLPTNSSLVINLLEDVKRSLAISTNIKEPVSVELLHIMWVAMFSFGDLYNQRI